MELVRTATGPEGTLGRLLCPEVRLDLWAIELPWRDNARNRSCIPAGQYEARVVQSPRFGRCYHVRGVPGRTGILIHAGNVAGDRDLGLRSHSYGCILPGAAPGTLWGQCAVLRSRFAVTDLMHATGGRPALLNILGEVA